IMYTQTFQPVAPKGVYLKQVTMDAMKVLEKTGRLGAAIGGNSSAVREIMQATGESVCMQLTIKDSNDLAVATIAKPGCTDYGKELQVIVQPLHYSGNNYMVKAESWYKKWD
ncbi:MAG: hypothetical protein HZA83_03535, partial [Thaumarchaeota archaeon]|nr:hypothetical protein [Nitrososphaerota archaeon]